MTVRHRRARPEQRSVFVMTIQGQAGRTSIHALRALLKILLRRHGFKCLDAREVRQ